jgi:thiamine pyrophosphate-dependent acetolactate synthase large subunit-like protein
VGDARLAAEMLVPKLELRGHKHEGYRTSAVASPISEAGAVARAMGAEGHHVASLGELGALRDRLSRPLDGPVVIDCRVDPTVVSETIPFIFAKEGRQAKPAQAS